VGHVPKVAARISQAPVEELHANGVTLEAYDILCVHQTLT
jgi:hypothetical protein